MLIYKDNNKRTCNWTIELSRT